MFQTRDRRLLDPTDASGMPSQTPSGAGGGWLTSPPWPLQVDVTLSYANEPPRGSDGTNCFVEDGPSGDPLDLLFVANRDIFQGEEIFIDYGLMYDRSSYAAGVRSSGSDDRSGSGGGSGNSR